jgi:hypothetical protein
MPEEEYFDANKIIVKKTDKSSAEEMIVKYHYSRKFSLCQIAYGIFYITDKQYKFIDAVEEKLIGVVVYSQPAGRSAASSISDLIKVDECMELIRLVILDGYGKNIESYCISQSFKLLQKEFPEIKCVISYADNEAGHCGIIYQAANFLYQGNSEIALMPNYSISLTNNPYKWMHSRTAFATFGSHNVVHLKRKIGHTFWRKKEAKKHRYFYLLGDKKEKKLILKNLKHPILSYPKNVNFKEEIQKIEVDNIDNNFFY